MSIKRSILVLAVATVAASVMAAPTPVGTWSGHVVMTASPSMPANQKKMFDTFKEKLTKLVLTLSLKADHTYTTSASGVKRPPQTGKWSLEGNSLTLTSTPPGPGGKGSQKFTISPNGKKLSMHDSRNGANVDVTFTR